MCFINPVFIILKFVAQELEFLSKFDYLPKDSDFACMPNSSPVPTCQVNIDFQCSLEKFLRDANQLTDNEVYTWIQVLI